MPSDHTTLDKDLIHLPFSALVLHTVSCCTWLAFMSFDRKYRLIEPIPELGGELGLLGREIASGQPVMVHFLSGGRSAENEELLRRASSAVLEAGDYQGTPYLVTRVLPDSMPLREWLDRVAPPVVAPAADVKIEPGEFTRMFQAPVAPRAKPKPEAAPVSTEAGEFTRMFQAPMAAQDKPAAELAPEKGEFTRMFQAPAPASAEPKPNHAAPVPDPLEFTRTLEVPVVPKARPEPETVAPADAPKQATAGVRGIFQAPVVAEVKPEPEASEFTRMFQAPPPSKEKALDADATRIFQPAPPPQAPAQSPLNAAAPGEFTRMFQSPAVSESGGGKYTPPAGPAPAGEFARMFEQPFGSTGSSASRPAAVPLPPAPAPVPQSPGGGDFTRMFGVQGGPPSAEPPPMAPVSYSAPRSGTHAGEATRIFQAPPSQPVPSAAPSGPSEFTRMFSAPAPAPVAEAPVTPQPPFAPAPPNHLKLVIVLGVLFLVAVAIVMYFLLRN